MADAELITAGKVAEKLGVSPGKVSQVLKQQGIQPDSKKGACGYYGPAKVKLIARALGK